MRRIFWAGAALALAMASGVAADDPILARQALMKANGKATTGDRADPQRRRPVRSRDGASGAQHLHRRRRQRRPALFPPGSDKGKTDALPAIWANKSDFDARFAKFGEDAKAALASVKDEATFKANFLPIFKNCQGCHETYRAKEP